MSKEQMIDNTRAQLEEAIIAHKSGDFDAASRIYERIINTDPHNANALHLLGLVERENGNIDKALTFITQALSHKPDFPAACHNLASLYYDMGNSEQAMHYYRRALELKPDYTSARHNILIPLLESSHPEEALYHCNYLLEQGYDVVALSNKVIALEELGRRDEARSIADYTRDICLSETKLPAPYTDRTAFHQELATFIQSHNSLSYAPKDHATELGWHTKELRDGVTPCSIALERILVDAIENHIAHVGNYPNSHPIPQNKPEQYTLATWSVVMESQGHQKPHVHPSAWISGVYYVQLPNTIGSNTHDGWIEFGRSHDNRYHNATPDTRLIQPLEGMIVTFPSYFWHRTIPFTSNQRRICVAFDVVPIKEPQ